MRYRSPQRRLPPEVRSRLGELLIARRRRAARELRRLRGLPRLHETTTTLPGCSFGLVDGPVFVSQWQALFVEERYAFVTESRRPRILDSGANIGLASLYWSRAFPDVRITAFEPDPRLAALLRTNLASCAASDVEVIEAAVWHEAGSVGFAAGSADAGRIRSDGDVLTVRSVRLGDYLQEPIALLKLDIEGAETDVLRSCADQLGAVERIFVEFHSFEGEDQRLAELLAILAGAGFRLHVVSEATSVQPFVHRKLFLGMDLQLNIYAYRL